MWNYLNDCVIGIVRSHFELRRASSLGVYIISFGKINCLLDGRTDGRTNWWAAPRAAGWAELIDRNCRLAIKTLNLHSMPRIKLGATPPPCRRHDVCATIFYRHQSREDHKKVEKKKLLKIDINRVHWLDKRRVSMGAYSLVACKDSRGKWAPWSKLIGKLSRMQIRDDNLSGYAIISVSRYSNNSWI